MWGKERVGYRVSPTGAYNSMSDSDPRATFSYLTERLNDLDIGYLHVVDPVNGTNRVAPHLRTLFENTFIVNGGYDEASGNAAIASGESRSRRLWRAVPRQSRSADPVQAGRRR